MESMGPEPRPRVDETEGDPSLFLRHCKDALPIDRFLPHIEIEERSTVDRLRSLISKLDH